jgi:iodothyronine deiodinase-like protein
MKSNRQEKIVFNQPKTFEERKAAAKILVERLHCNLPLAIDSMDNRAETIFSAWPERIYILAPGGRVIYKGGMGPFGFHPEEAEKVLAGLAGKPSSAPAS